MQILSVYGNKRKKVQMFHVVSSDVFYKFISIAIIWLKLLFTIYKLMFAFAQTHGVLLPDVITALPNSKLFRPFSLVPGISMFDCIED